MNESETDNQPESSAYSDPIYKQISLRNGEINKMSKDTLKTRLQQHHLDTRCVVMVISYMNSSLLVLILHSYKKLQIQRLKSVKKNDYI